MTLVLDAAAATRVRALWQALAEAGLGDSLPRLGYPPHLTLLTWADALADDVAAALPALAGASPRRVTLATFGAVGADPAVLWLGVVATPALLGLHAACAAAVPATPHPHYAPGAWMPHVSLATDLPPARLGGALDCAARHFTSFTAVIAAIEAVTYPPVAVVARRPLG